MNVVLTIALIAAVGAALIALSEWLLVRLHDEDWLLERARWRMPVDDCCSGEAWVALSRHDAQGMVPANMEAHELRRRWAADMELDDLQP